MSLSSSMARLWPGKPGSGPREKPHKFVIHAPSITSMMDQAELWSASKPVSGPPSPVVTTGGSPNEQTPVAACRACDTHGVRAACGCRGAPHGVAGCARVRAAGTAPGPGAGPHVFALRAQSGGAPGAAFQRAARPQHPARARRSPPHLAADGVAPPAGLSGAPLQGQRTLERFRETVHRGVHGALRRLAWTL